ncbi:nucleotidyltransferase domain-containing protein [candidate division KSB1 bacterium]|nr:nucleotidyltransferase domain-containing protein [candidate division KSB1 bacterium]
MDRIRAFCERWKVVEFSLFGSVLTDQFRPDSDVDVMVEFARDATWGFDIVEMEHELATIFGRRVDLLTKRSIVQSENYLMRNSILSNIRTLYAA